MLLKHYNTNLVSFWFFFYWISIYFVLVYRILFCRTEFCVECIDHVIREFVRQSSFLIHSFEDRLEIQFTYSESVKSLKRDKRFLTKGLFTTKSRTRESKLLLLLNCCVCIYIYIHICRRAHTYTYEYTIHIGYLC